MNLRMLVISTLTIITIVVSHAAAAGPEPAAGTWQVFSNKTGAPDGKVRTFVQDGRLVGVVEELAPGVPEDTKCTKCSGAQKDQPVKGLVIMWGLEKDGDGWSGGTILDPQTGSKYRCNVKPVHGDSLEVRGFVGVSLFGRTQTWKRAQ